jgi:hypothetical protein
MQIKINRLLKKKKKIDRASKPNLRSKPILRIFWKPLNLSSKVANKTVDSIRIIPEERRANIFIVAFFPESKKIKIRIDNNNIINIIIKGIKKR